MGEFWGADGFMRRGDCGEWSVLMMDIYAIANLSTLFAYVAIAVVLWMAVRQDRRHASERTPVSPRERTHIRTTYATFIITCGLGHADGVLAFIWPAYHVFAMLHLITAAASWYAVYVTFRYRGRLLADI